MELIVEGNKPDLPQPICSGVIGRKFIHLRNKEYIIDVWPHWSDGELCWAAYKWNGSSWPKIGCFTRSQENRFPKTIARLASEFTDKLKAIKAGAMLV